MGEVAAGGGDGAAGMEIATLPCRKAERFAEKHGGKMCASTSWSRARKAGEEKGAAIPPRQRAQERRALGTPVPLRMASCRVRGC